MTREDKKINISSKSKIDKTALKAKEMDLQVGWLGKFFGSDENAPKNICGIVVMILVLVGGIVCIFNTRVDPSDYLSHVVPVVTTILGYLFGKSTK